MAASVWLTLQLSRVCFAVVFNLGESSGTTAGVAKAGGLALAVSLAPLLGPVLPRLVGGRRALVCALAAVAAVRVGVQLVHPVPVWLATLGLALGLIGVSLLLLAFGRRDAGDGHLFVLGLLMGLAVDTALRTAFWTWDFGWQPGAGLILLALVSAAAVGVLIFLAGDDVAATDDAAAIPSWAAAFIGPFLFLQVVFLQNVAFVGSSGHVSLPVAGAVLLLADAGAIAIVSLGRHRVGRPAFLVAAPAMIVLAYLLRQVRGPGLLFIVFAGQVLATLCLSIGISDIATARVESARVWRSSVAFAAGTFVLVLFVLIYQVVYRIKLPIPNTVVAPVAALLLALAVLRARPKERAPLGVVPIAAVVALLAIPAGIAVARPVPHTSTVTSSVRMMTYNVHLGIDGGGQSNPEGVARVIEGQNPDVVCLQEVVRGWPGPGGIDLAEWLSQRLKMRYTYAPAADDQFGNVVLTRLPIVSHQAFALPRVHAPMHRSYLATTINIGGGRTVTVIDAHLEGDRSDHAVQAQRLVDRWGHTPHTVVAGDMNMQPANADVSIFTRSGLISAQDEAGQGTLPSATNPKFPGDRPDWIFGSPDLRFSDFGIGAVSPSDHRALVVTVTAG